MPDLISELLKISPIVAVLVYALYKMWQYIIDTNEKNIQYTHDLIDKERGRYDDINKQTEKRYNELKKEIKEYKEETKAEIKEERMLYNKSINAFNDAINEFSNTNSKLDIIENDLKELKYIVKGDEENGL